MLCTLPHASLSVTCPLNTINTFFGPQAAKSCSNTVKEPVSGKSVFFNLFAGMHQAVNNHGLTIAAQTAVTTAFIPVTDLSNQFSNKASLVQNFPNTTANAKVNAFKGVPLANLTIMLANRSMSDISLVYQELPTFPSDETENKYHQQQEQRPDDEKKSLTEIICERFCDRELSLNVLPCCNPEGKVILYAHHSTNESSSTSSAPPQIFFDVIQKRFKGRVVFCPHFLDPKMNSSEAEATLGLEFIAKQVLDWAWFLWRTRAHTVATPYKKLSDTFFPSVVVAAPSSTAAAAAAAAVSASSSLPSEQLQQEQEQEQKDEILYPRSAMTFYNDFGTQNMYVRFNILPLLRGGQKYNFLPATVRNRDIKQSLRQNRRGDATYEKALAEDAVVQRHLENHSGQAVIIANSGIRSYPSYIVVYVSQGIFAVGQKVCLDTFGLCVIEAIEGLAPIRKRKYRPARKNPENFASAGMLVGMKFSHLSNPSSSHYINNSGLREGTFHYANLVTAFTKNHGFDVVPRQRQEEVSTTSSSKKTNNSNTEPIIDYQLTRRQTNIPKFVQPIAITLELLPPELQYGEDTTSDKAQKLYDFISHCVQCEEQAANNTTTTTNPPPKQVRVTEVGTLSWSVAATINSSLAGRKVQSETFSSVKEDGEKFFESPQSRTMQLLFFPTAAVPFLSNLTKRRLVLPSQFNPNENPPLVRLAPVGAEKFFRAKVTRMVTDFDILEDFLCPSLPPPSPVLFSYLDKNGQEEERKKIIDEIKDRLHHDGSADNVNANNDNSNMIRRDTSGCRLGVGFASPLNDFFIRETPEHLLSSIDPSSWSPYQQQQQQISSSSSSSFLAPVDRSRLLWSHTKWGRCAFESRYAPFPVCLARVSSVAVCFSLTEVVSKMMTNELKKDDTTLSNQQYCPLLPGFLTPLSLDRLKTITGLFEEYLAKILLPSSGLQVPSPCSSSSSDSHNNNTKNRNSVSDFPSRIPAILDACCTAMFAWHGSNSGPIFTNSRSLTQVSPFRRELFRIASSIDFPYWIQLYRFGETRGNPPAPNAGQQTSLVCYNMFAEKGLFEYSWLGKDNSDDFLARLPYQLLQMRDLTQLLNSLLIGDGPALGRLRVASSSASVSTSKRSELRGPYYDSLLLAALRCFNISLVEALIDAIEVAVLDCDLSSTSAAVLMNTGSSDEDDHRNNQKNPVIFRRSVPLLKDTVVNCKEYPLIPDVPWRIAESSEPAFKYCVQILSMYSKAIYVCFPEKELQSKFCSTNPMCINSIGTFHKLLLSCARITLYAEQFKSISSSATTAKIPDMMRWMDFQLINAPKIRSGIEKTINKFTRFMGASIAAKELQIQIAAGRQPVGTKLPLPSAPMSAVYWELMKILTKITKLSMQDCQLVCTFLIPNG